MNYDYFEKYKSIYVVVLLTFIAYVFFILSNHTFFWVDDFTAMYDGDGAPITSLKQIFRLAIESYLTWDGSILNASIQYLFCGMLPSKIIFDAANSLFFALFVALMGYLLMGNLQNWSVAVLMLICECAWLLLPQQNETFFWVVGSTAYLWTTVQTLLYIVLFIKYKNKGSSIGALTILGICSFVLASSHIIAGVAVCGALIVYYLVLHRDLLNRTVVIMSICYGLGVAIMLFAPGNFVRQAALDANGHSIFNVYACLRCFMVLKLFYLLVFLLIICLLIKSKRVLVKSYFNNNQFLFLVLGFSILAYCFVFRPAPRAAFFTEVLSLILILKLLNRLLSIQCQKTLAIMLCVVCCIDYGYAFQSIVSQEKQNDDFLNELVDNNGEVCLSPIQPTHRMALSVEYPTWTYYALQQIYSLDTIALHPAYYCDILNNVNILNQDNLISGNEYAYLYDQTIIMRMPDSICHHFPIEGVVSYHYPQLWHRDLREKLGLFSYNRIMNFRVMPTRIGLNEDIIYYVVGAVGHKDEIIDKVEVMK